MRTLWSKLRAVLGFGLIWGLPGAAVGAIGGAVAGLVGGVPLLASMATGSVIVGASFSLLGMSFASALTLGEGRRRTMDELSPRRAAVWGAMGGGAAPALVLLFLQPDALPLLSDPELLGALVAAIASYGGLSAALAGGTVALANQAPDALGSGSADGRAELLGAPAGT